MKNIPICTCILPTYNRLDRLKKTLPIFLSTQRKDIEVLILNDCSTDGTKNFIEEYSLNDNRIKLYNQEKNVHLLQNYIDGFKKVKSPYAIMLSDDDYMVGDYINNCIETFEKFQSVGLIHNKVNRVDLNSKIDYDYFKAGEEAIKGIMFQKSSCPGLAFRMSEFKFDLVTRKYGKFGLNLYGVDKVCLSIAKSNDVIVFKNSGMREMDFGRDRNTVLDEKIIFQRRTPDFNMGELTLNAFDMLDSYFFNEYCFKLTRWIFVNIVKNISDEKYIEFLNAIYKTPVGQFHYIFFIRILFFRFKFKALYFLIINILKPNNFIYNLKTTLYVFRKLLRKLKPNVKISL